MENSTASNVLVIAAATVSVFAMNLKAANALSPLTPPGMELCMNPGGCPKPPAGGGGIIMPPAPPGPGGGGGGGGGFGKGLGAGLGVGIGLGIVNSLNRPRTVVVQPAPTYVQPAPAGDPHVAFCLNKFKSYNPSTNLYFSYSGRYKPCYSPYR